MKVTRLIDLPAWLNQEEPQKLAFSVKRNGKWEKFSTKFYAEKNKYFPLKGVGEIDDIFENIVNVIEMVKEPVKTNIVLMPKTRNLCRYSGFITWLILN